MSARDMFDVPLDDPVPRDEMALRADVMVATNESVGAMNPQDIDRLLGVPAARVLPLLVKQPRICASR